MKEYNVVNLGVMLTVLLSAVFWASCQMTRGLVQEKTMMDGCACDSAIKTECPCNKSGQECGCDRVSKDSCGGEGQDTYDDERSLSNN